MGSRLPSDPEDGCGVSRRAGELLARVKLAGCLLKLQIVLKKHSTGKKLRTKGLSAISRIELRPKPSADRLLEAEARLCAAKAATAEKLLVNSTAANAYGLR